MQANYYKNCISFKLGFAFMFCTVGADITNDIQ